MSDEQGNLGWRDIAEAALDDGPDDWMAQALEAMAQLRGPHLAKKQATILALVDARLSGRSDESVFRQPDTCSRTIWHAKWKRDPIIQEALEAATQAALNWHHGRALRAIAQAREMMTLSTPAAAEEVIKRLRSADDNIVLRAAFGLLDRADFETAPKASTRSEQDEPLDDEEQAAIEEALRQLANKGNDDDTETDPPDEHGADNPVGPAPSHDGA